VTDIQPFPIPAALADLARVYADAGHEIWLVGGCVRDHVAGRPCKDVDLATSATPDEQVALCDGSGHRWFGTGLSHGTITVLAGGEPYEITTFRTDVETDGRHAVVEWTRSLETDLARRDLTINAVAMSLDGRIVDPFGGLDDLANGRVRFVGDAGTRIAEDHLRILRWFRFLGRFGNGTPDPVSLTAIRDGAVSLARISVERVWAEMSKIVVGPHAASLVHHMHHAGVLAALGVQQGDAARLARAVHCTPAAALAAWQGDAAPGLLDRWHASNDEIAEAAFFAERLSTYGEDAARVDLVADADRRQVLDILRMNGDVNAVVALRHWEIPVFPVQGRDLVAAGMKPGPELGAALRSLRGIWTRSGWTVGRDELVAAIARP
jgi:tRNA nucleotidyltransferase/poly(A) polymerase